MLDSRADVEPVDPADHLVDGAESELRHELAQLLGDEAMKLIHVLGLPANFLRSSGSWVAMPTGQVFRWQTRIMMQPRAISGGGEAEFLGSQQRRDHHVAAGLDLAVASRAPTRPRRSFITSVWCVSARPSSHGRPACLMRVCGEAPVPPSSPLIRTDRPCPWRRRRRWCRRRPRRPASR